jgi:general secretion pathway protein B
LPVYADLSRELRRRLPDLTISLHFFSANPARRMVRINNRLLYEGEAVTDGLVVHEITPTSTVFDYQGLLFEIRGPGG